jgi:predicted transposase YbfD/YdcC
VRYRIYVRCDALSKKTFQVAKANGIKLVVQVKENQKNLLKKCEEICKMGKVMDVYNEEEEINRNRIGQRKIEIYEYPMDKLRGKYIKIVIKVKRMMWKKDTKTKTVKQTREVAYYVSNYVEYANEMGKIIRRHRHIENKNHYVKDVSLEEDKSRIRKNPEIMAILRSIALNILRKNEIKNIKTALYENSLNIQKVITLF